MRLKAYITACLFFFILFSGLIHAEKSKKPAAKKPSAVTQNEVTFNW